MTGGHVGSADSGAVLATRALARESGRARRLLAAQQWHPAPADAHAAAAVLARLTAPLPTRKHSSEQTRIRVLGVAALGAHGSLRYAYWPARDGWPSDG